MLRSENYKTTRFYFNDERVLIECWGAYGGKTGFQHRANVFLNGSFTPYKNKFYKVQYYNRTWEKYKFQSLLNHVLSSLLKDKAITQEEYEQFKNEVVNG